MVFAVYVDRKWIATPGKPIFHTNDFAASEKYQLKNVPFENNPLFKKVKLPNAIMIQDLMNYERHLLS